MSEETKRCSRCGEEKDLRTGFGRDKGAKDGFHSWCKECKAASSRIHYAENREKVLAKSKRYREKNQEKLATRRKKYYEENRDKEAARCKLYYEKNREKVLGIQKIYDRSLRGQWRALKQYARRREWGCDISENTFAGLRSRPCFYCGSRLPVRGYGLDRLDSSKGYVKGNVVPCCWSCNNEKGSMPWKDYAMVCGMRRSGVPIMESERDHYMLEGYWKLWEEDAGD